MIKHTNNNIRELRLNFSTIYSVKVILTVYKIKGKTKEFMIHLLI